jgi:hypothetical protein
MDYPLYRKNSIGNSVYKIVSDAKFIEKQRVGQNVLEHQIEANQYPEMLLIQDMIDCREGIFFEINSEEYSDF